jgi:hypothetical protein
VKTVDTFTATIWVGLKERDTGVLHSVDEVRSICQQYCDEIGFCVTVTPTEFIYTDGNEPGVAIGIINYPRFPDAPENILSKALTLAERFLYAFNQYKVSVVCPDKTYMLENERL